MRKGFVIGCLIFIYRYAMCMKKIMQNSNQRDPADEAVFDYNSGFPPQLCATTLFNITKMASGASEQDPVYMTPMRAAPGMDDTGNVIMKITHACFANANKGKDFFYISYSDMGERMTGPAVRSKLHEDVNLVY